jgi:acetoacetyl-CoA synthetase
MHANETPFGGTTSTAAGPTLAGKGGAPIWQPGPDAVSDASITRFTELVTATSGHRFDGYQDLWSWSVEHLEEFWSAIWEFFGIEADGDPTTVLSGTAMPGASWFPQTRLNYAEHALRAAADPALADAVAITEIAEDGTTTTTTWTQLRNQVGALATWLRQTGVRPGDRVVGYLPNITPTVVAFLGTVSVGAIWSCCAQDYSAAGAAARFAQLDPVVLFAADGYRWSGRSYPRQDEVDALQQALPTLRATVHVPHLGATTRQPGAPSLTSDGGGDVDWHATIATPMPLRFERVAFNAPLWVLFSSGTTGVPKGIVHGHGGIVLEHLKLVGLHLDLGQRETLFWYTTPNWMMWNVNVSGLLLGGRIVLYDGSPTYPDVQRLWRISADQDVAVLGVSPGYLAACAKAAITPAADMDLTRLRVIGSTGAPLPEPPYHWVHDEIGGHVQLASVSGGTDVASGFAGGSPITPVWPGEISAPNLGAAVAVWDQDGQPVQGQPGELVITRPMPSMPLYFWNDVDGRRYHEAYFDTFPGTWRHGDMAIATERGSLVITGRSDATLNRHGVRLGSTDIYRVVDELPYVVDSLVVGAELTGGRYWLALFIVLSGDSTLSAQLIADIEAAIAEGASPRHVPDDVIAVTALPHTRTGKRMELPVKRLVQGHSLEEVAAPDAVDDYDALAQFARYANGAKE